MSSQRGDLSHAQESDERQDSHRTTAELAVGRELGSQQGRIYADKEAFRPMRNLRTAEQHIPQILIAHDTGKGSDKSSGPGESATDKVKARYERGKPTVPYKSADAHAFKLIEDKIVETRQALKSDAKRQGKEVAVSRKEDVHVTGIFDPESWQKFGELIDNLKPGDQDQKLVTDLGIEPVKTADLKNSSETTKTVDRALADAGLDPKHYNCNDYVVMFVLAQENERELQSYIKQRNGPSFTGSPERFLIEHSYRPIESGPLKEGDIIVIHGPKGEHAAVVCRDQHTRQLYTMQKPNPKEMPVRLSLDQLSRAEKIEDTSIEVYRKQ